MPLKNTEPFFLFKNQHEHASTPLYLNKIPLLRLCNVSLRGGDFVFGGNPDGKFMGVFSTVTIMKWEDLTSRKKPENRRQSGNFF